MYRLRREKADILISSTTWQYGGVRPQEKRNSMSYVTEILQSNEKILATGKLHWIIYWPAMILMIVAVVALSLGPFGLIVFILFGVAAVVAATKEWLEQWVTEIVVTDRRVIYKTGLIQRHTAEMNMDKVESVIVDQSILGRLLDYGSIHIRGTGEGLEHLHYISSPVSLRNTITAK